nr:hypothetical protein Iba_scaffold4328CG0010 [Ipomoea batatas]
MEVSATTKGSNADKTWETSAFFSTPTATILRLSPNNSKDKFPSLLPNSGEEVEHATATNAPPRKFREQKGLFFRAVRRILGLGLNREGLRDSDRDLDGITDISGDKYGY